jgi:hypothetical protein
MRGRTSSLRASYGPGPGAVWGSPRNHHAVDGADRWGTTFNPERKKFRYGTLNILTTSGLLQRVATTEGRGAFLRVCTRQSNLSRSLYFPACPATKVESARSNQAAVNASSCCEDAANDPKRWRHTAKVGGYELIASVLSAADIAPDYKADH